jgi:hypothetical protein
MLVYESAEGLFSADPVVGEVDLPRSFVCLSRWELAEGTVRPGSVVVQQVFGQHLAQVVLVDVQKCRSVVPVPCQNSRTVFELVVSAISRLLSGTR